MKKQPTQPDRTRRPAPTDLAPRQLEQTKGGIDFAYGGGSTWA